MSGGVRAGGDFLKVARLMGADAALAKPFTRQELLDSLGEVLTGTAVSWPLHASGPRLPCRTPKHFRSGL